jgi:TnpA family transposase
MPRIRNWEDLTFFRPSRDAKYRHIDGLFSDTVDWQLIEDHSPDLLQVAPSIKAGTISSAQLLRRLGSYSRHNRLYQAFRELGRAVRTIFLLEFLNDANCVSRSPRPPTRWRR